MQRLLSGKKLLTVVRVLIIVEMVTMLVSTAVAVGVECLLFLLFIVSAELRQRFLASLKQPIVLMSMLFYAVVTTGLFYGLADWEEGVDFWLSWRKLLLVPIAVSVFEDLRWKRRLAVAFIGFASLVALVSAASYLLNKSVYYRFPVGIVLNNHATQGMVFALAIFAGVILLRSYPPSAKRLGLAVAALSITLGNLIFITPGRSGYLALLVFVMVAVFVLVAGRLRYVLLVGMPLFLAVLLMASPVAKEKIVRGINEVANLDKAEHFSSMGIRMVMWKNTVGIMRHPDFPVTIGYGTGGFKEAYRPQVAGQTGWKAEVVDDCHNQYMRIAVEHGVIGLLIFLGLIAACFKQTVPWPYRQLGIGALLGWCVTSFFSGHFGTFVEGRLIFIWVGAMLAVPAVTQDEAISVDSRA